MPLNPDEVRRVRTALPDETKSLTDDAVANGAADTMIQQAQAIRGHGPAVTALTTERDTARTELADAKVKLISAEAKIPAAVDPKLAARYADLECREVDHLVTTGCILPPQAAALKDSLKPVNGNPAAVVTADGAVLYPGAAVMAALKLNKPAGLTGEVTGGQGAQVVTRVTPGTENQDPGPESVTPARKAELLAMAGMGSK